MYVYGSEERYRLLEEIDHLEAASVLKRSEKEKRLDWEEKVLHGPYLR